MSTKPLSDLVGDLIVPGDAVLPENATDSQWAEFLTSSSLPGHTCAAESIAENLQQAQVKAEYLFYYAYLQPKSVLDPMSPEAAKGLIETNAPMFQNFLNAMSLAGIVPKRILRKNYGMHLDRFSLVHLSFNLLSAQAAAGSTITQSAWILLRNGVLPLPYCIVSNSDKHLAAIENENVMGDSRTSGGHNDEHTSIILDRLENLERIVANFGSSETATTAASQHHASPGAGWLQAYSPAVSNAGLSFAGVSPEAGRINVAATVPSPSPQAALHPHIAIQPESSDSTSAAMTIPIAHSTTTGDLLRSESIRLLVGDYPPFALSRVEVKRNLIEAYFNLVGTQHPVLDRSEFMLVYDKVVAEGILAITHSVCLVFVVLALGAIAQVSSFRDVSEDAPPGIDFFEPALRHLVDEWPMFFGADIVLPQAMYLASLYFGYLSRPLQTWRLVHMASTSTQQILLWTTPTPALTRLCWAVFILECDTLAEHHLPRSGVEQLVEDMPFPDCGTPADPHMLSWLANISSRKLLNRIHNALYDQCRKQTLPKESLEGSDPSFRISHELAHQLREWFTLLPESIKPPAILENMTIEQAVLKMRYHAAGDIIFRPFLLRAFSLVFSGTGDPTADTLQCKRVPNPLSAVYQYCCSAFKATFCLLGNLPPLHAFSF
uniref:Transcription factor domain-containing protein n=1 Tax=Bionectria ochroleuca TaxID=29856 RepID=A0A8H7K9D8_BIOOC